METKFKQLFKEAVLEALVEFTNGGIAVASTAEGDGTGDSGDKGKDKGKDESQGTSGQGGGSENSSGGGLNDGRPIPDVGVGTWSLR